MFLTTELDGLECPRHLEVALGDPGSTTMEIAAAVVLKL